MLNYPEDKTEDSIATDVQSLKSFVNKIFSRVSGRVVPALKRLPIRQTISKPSQIFERYSLGSFVKPVLIAVALVVFIVLGINLLKGLGSRKPNAGVVQTIPSPATYKPYRPSPWADDPEVLRLEEDINVLERELARTSLREDKLLPPKLDFNISF